MTELQKKLLLAVARYCLWMMHPPNRQAKHTSYEELSHLIEQVENE